MPRGFALITAMLLALPALGQQYLMMPDSAANRLVLLNPETGAVENDAYFTLAGGLPFHAMQVGQEIWVSEQNADRVSRWSLTGEYLGAVEGNPPQTMDNVRGMEYADGRVYVSRNANSIEVFDTNGAFVFRFSTSGQASSPFSVLEHQGALLVGASVTTFDEVHRYTYGGVSLGTFNNGIGVRFVEQLGHDLDGHVLAASFTDARIATLHKDTGQILSSFPAFEARGVHQLRDGSVVWTNSAGIHRYDPGTGVDELIYAGSGRYIDLLDLTPPPPPCGPQDFNGDGDGGTDQDIEAFFACLGGNCCAACWRGGADFNGDGDAGTDQDIEAFFRVLGGGDC
ncbi:MAG TPA: hypothetical protein VD997_05200 [Phycisphaerales bacterium]|nr:hypothetical protein [Phycisphaerales bacterium]